MLEPGGHKGKKFKALGTIKYKPFGNFLLSHLSIHASVPIGGVVFCISRYTYSPVRPCPSTPPFHHYLIASPLVCDVRNWTHFGAISKKPPHLFGSIYVLVNITLIVLGKLNHGYQVICVALVTIIIIIKLIKD